MTDGTIGRFRIRQIIRQVGRGVSYLAEDPERGGRVLLRVFPPLGASGENWVQRIRDIMSSLRDAEDPQLVNFSDTGVLEQLPYVSRPYLDGITIAELGHGVLGVTDVVEVGRALGGALTQMHRAGIVHGQIRPSNLVIANREIRIVDFGLGFEAPDTLRREGDVHALGTVLYDLFAGKPYIAGAPLNPRMLNPSVPAAAGQLVHDILSGDVTDAAEVTPRLTSIAVRAGEIQPVLPHAKKPMGAVSPGILSAESPPSPRVVNTWFEGDPPFPPPRALESCLFHFNIGAPRTEVAASIATFTEPDFGNHSSIDLLVSLFSEDFTIATRQQSITLQRTGDTEVLTTRVIPRHAGTCRLEVVICLIRELDVLQHLHVDVDVAPAFAPEPAAVMAGAPNG